MGQKEKEQEPDLLERRFDDGRRLSDDLVRSSIDFEGVKKYKEKSRDFKKGVTSTEDVFSLVELLKGDHVEALIQWLTEGFRFKKKSGRSWS